MAEISFLPAQLRRIPVERHAWELWAAAVSEYRIIVRDRCEQDVHFRNDVDRLCALDNAYWLTMFGFIFEPRTRTGVPSGKKPFIPFAYQVDIMRWHGDRMRDEVHPDGFLPKPRGLGVSWDICAIAVHGLLYAMPHDVLFASRTQEYVDVPGIKKSLFWKLDYLLDNLPHWMLPEGFSTKRGTPTRSEMKIINPVNGNTITGESSTDNLGRGDRATWAFIDEAAAYPNFGVAWDTLEGTTDHRFCTSTEKGVSEFNRMWTLLIQESPDEVFELFWRDNPYFDAVWYERTRGRYEKAGRLPAFRQEYEKDPTAGSGERVYPMAERIVPGQFPYVPRGGQVYCFIDPGIRDATAIHLAQWVAATGRLRLIESYENAGQVAKFYATILTSTPLSGIEGYEYNEYDYEFMDLMATVTDPVIFIGDPYGRNRGGEGVRSYYEALSEEAAKLTNHKMHISILTSYADEDKGYEGRRDALASLIPMMDFNDTQQVRVTIQGLKEYAYKTISNSRELVNPTSKPVHSWASHRVTSLEFGAVHLRGGRILGQHQGRMAPQRVTLGGKTVGLAGRNSTREPAWSRGADT